MSVHWGGKGPGHVSRWPRGVGAMSPYSGATMLLDFLNPVLDPRITFSRGTNATLIDSTGKLTYAPANLLLNSEGTVAQLNASGNVTDAAPTISGFANSIQFGDNSVTRFAYKTLTLSANVPLIASFFVQMDDNSAPVVGTGATGGDLAIIIDGVYTPTVNVSLVSGSIYRVWGLLAAPTGGSFRNVGIIKNTGQSTKGFRVTGFQLEQVTYQTTPSTYAATTASAYYGPRFDYDPVTLAPRGLLIEEARTNLLTYSQDWTNATWSKTNITVTAAATASPDGTVNAQKLQATATAATNVSTAAIAATATSASFSVYVKQGSSATTANSFALRNNTTATNLVLGTLNYATGVWTYSTGSTGVTVSNAGNGWWRLQISASAGITVGDLLIAYTGFLGASATAGDHLFAYGAQLEAGSFATSYIPTVASTVTRNADVATMTGTNFSSWYNQSEGTFVSDADNAAIGNLFILDANNSTANEEIRLSTTATSGAFLVFQGGAVQANIVIGTVAANTPFKIAGAYAANNANAAFNGAVSTTDTSFVSPTVNRLQIGASFTQYLNGHVRTIAYFNTRLPNAQLQTLTAPSLATTLSLDFTSGSYNVGF